MLEKEKERRIKLNNRIEILERRIQEAEAAEVNEMVRSAKVSAGTACCSAAAVGQHHPEPGCAGRGRCCYLQRRKIPMMKIKKFGALLVSAVLCIGMAAPAFAYEGDTTPVEATCSAGSRGGGCRHHHG